MKPVPRLAHLLNRAGCLLQRVAARMAPEPRATALQAWRDARGDLTLRQEYPLSPGDIVWDVGGFLGQWTSDIVARYLCHIHVFEPSPSFAESIRKRFSKNPKVVVHPHGLGDHTQQCRLVSAADASSTEIEGPDGHVVQIHDATDTWRRLGSDEIALAKLNVEGAEYGIIENLGRNGTLRAFRHLQVQFHDFVPDARERRARCCAVLERTHRRTWCYEFVWENWERLP